METEWILNESQFLQKKLTGKRLVILGRDDNEEYDYEGKIESVKRKDGFLVFEVSEFCHSRGRGCEWHQQKDKHTIQIRKEENGKFFEAAKDSCYLFYSKKSEQIGDVGVFVIR